MAWDHKCPNGQECLNAGDICDGGWLCCRDDEKPTEITAAMIDAGTEQARVDSSLCLNARQRIERVLRAALTRKVNRALFEADLDRRRADPTLTA
jgi:hypothetical protein